MKIISHSVKETNGVARDLANKIVKNQSQAHALIIALEGELGAGKTTFVKGFAKVLGIKTHITSPTFVLLKTYDLKHESYGRLIHIDAYRLKNYRDLLPLGVREAIADQKNIIMIEWAERVKPILPKKYIKIHIDHVNERTRKISIL